MELRKKERTKERQKGRQGSTGTDFYIEVLVLRDATFTALSQVVPSVVCTRGQSLIRREDSFLENIAVGVKISRLKDLYEVTPCPRKDKWLWIMHCERRHCGEMALDGYSFTQAIPPP